MKYLLTCLISLMPVALYAEANVAVDNESQTFLLQAPPGTLSGMPSEAENAAEGDAQQPLRYKSTLQTPLRYKSQRSGNPVESYKFPQYGQVHGRYNPWSEEAASRRLPPSLPPANPYYSNPWDLSGRLPGQQQNSYQRPPPVYPRYSSGMPPAYDAFNSDPAMNPDFPDAIYRDTNPASRPLLNGMFPGMRGDDFDFPFSPFKMF